MKKIALVSLFIIFAFGSFAQRGKNGNVTVTSTVTVNEYTTLTVDAASGSNTITVANSGLNTKGRFTGNLAAGDLVMIIQMQGATINGAPEYPWDGPPSLGMPQDSSWGYVTSYNNCGNYEFQEVSSVPSGTTIKFDCGLTNNYTAAGKVQVIRVPRYNTLTINSGGSITPDTWDSATGGVVSIEVLGNTVINTGGNINATGDGFRGATLDSNGATYGVNNFDVNGTLYLWGKTKGEGIAGYEWDYDQFGGRNCRGAAANAGGGGNAHNAGGGGGANGGVVANWINGDGNPDVSSANKIAAWKLEYSWFSTFTASGGGRGGYTFSSSNQNPVTVAPGNASWSGDDRRSHGGLGGRPLDYSTGKIFMGGGGGAGDQDDNDGGTGGNGGGLVYLMSYGTVTGAGQIMANGNNGGNAAGTAASTSYNGKDGAGGAGGGGTVIINSVGNISGVSVQTNGGTGGNQVMTKGSLFVGTIKEAEGPGGGGGGGYIATSNVGVTETATGGANGTTNSPTMVNFNPNGATAGGAGTTGASIANFYIVAKNDTICSGNTATLTASLTGTVPGGTTIEWYNDSVGGTAIATGSPYTTGVLTKDTTLYVGSCPGTYRQAVKIIITGSSSVTISPPATICSGNSTNLTASGGTAYSWTPAAGLSSTTISNPVASPTVTTTYSVAITTPCGTQNESVVITVTPGPSVSATASSPTICSGDSTTINASGATTYTWSPSTGLSATTGNSVWADPGSSQTYVVTGTTAGCVGTQTVVLTVNATPTVTASATPASICMGASTSLSANGASTFTWSPSTALSATTGSPVTADPVANITYTVTGTTSGCTSSAQTVAVTVNPNPSVSVNPPSPTVCAGGSINLTASGATNYTWTPATGLSATTGANVSANPASTTTYTVIGFNPTGCSDTVKVVVTVGASITAAITGKDTVCAGSSTTLTASGGSNFTWSNGSTTAVITVTPASTSTYSVLVSSGTCSDSSKVTVTVNPMPSPSVSGSNSICSGTSTTLTASGGGTYSWNTGSTTSSINVSPGVSTTYTVQVAKGSCVKDTTYAVTVTASPTVTISPPAAICSGQSVGLSATGGGTYAWSTGASTSNINVTPASTTTYTLSVTNGICSKDTSTVVNVTATPTVTISGNTSICQGNNTTLTATGGGNYAWSTGATTSAIAITPAATTTYSLQVSNGSCNTDTSIAVNVTPTPTVTITAAPSICSGQTSVLNVTGGGTYSWSTGSTSNTISVTPGSTTTYTVSITSGACVIDTFTSVNVTATPTVSVTGKDSICSGSNTILTASGGGNYSWSTGSSVSSITVNPLVTTTYTVTVTNGSCSADTTEVVHVFSAPTIAVTGDSACRGVGSTITAAGGITYKWLPGGATTNSITAKPTTTSTYSVVVNSPCGIDTLTAVVNVAPLPVITVTGKDSICSGNTTILTASGATTYAWSTGSTNTDITVTPGSTITYTVTGTLGKCSGDTTVTVKVTPTPTVSIAGVNKVCPGDSVTLIANGTSGAYLWSTGATTSSITVVPGKTTTYGVSVTKGCSDSTWYTVNVSGVAPLIVCCDTTILPGGTANLNASGSIAYVWSPQTNVNCYTCPNTTASPTVNTTYIVTGTDSNGCKTTGEIVVDIKCMDFSVPNVFTPNSDGQNDVFLIQAQNEVTYSIEIFDRWGKKMFSSTSPTDYWNGKINNTGDNVPDGVYFYVIKSTCSNNDYSHQGFVQIIR